MKNLKVKFLIALLSFTVGILSFYLSLSLCSMVVSEDFLSTFENSLSEKQPLNKVEIRFIRFVQGERQIEAEVEVINNSKENLYYISFSKDSYPFPSLKRDGNVVPDKRSRCGTGLTEQILSPGERVFFRLPKSEVTYEPTEYSWRETDKPTQIGFPFEVGNKPIVKVKNKKSEVFWSEEIKFP